MSFGGRTMRAAAARTPLVRALLVGFLGAGLPASLAACRAGVPGSFDPGDIDVLERRLVASLGGNRFIEPQLSVEVEHRDCRSDLADHDPLEPSRCPTTMSTADADARDLLLDVRRSLLAVRESAHPDWRRLWAIWYLAFPEVSVANAVETLEEAVAADAGDARSLADLAAAYFVRAQVEDDPASFVPALDAAMRAVLQDPDLPQALFNRALALEALSLDVDAVAAWDDYVAADPRSRWSHEAAERQRVSQEALRRRATAPGARNLLRAAARDGDDSELERLVAEHPRATRLLIMDELIPRWAEMTEDAATAGALLREAQRLSGALDEMTGNRLPADIVETIVSATRGQGDLAGLRSGHQKFERGVAAYWAALAEQGVGEERNEDAAVPPFTQAREILEDARRDFDRMGSPARYRARYYQMLSLYQQVQYEEALETIGRLTADIGTLLDGPRDDARSRGYLALAADAEHMRGTIAGFQGRHLAALAGHIASARWAAQVGEVELIAREGADLARAYRRIGSMRDSWRHRYAVLRAAEHIDDSNTRYRTFDDAAKEARERGYLAVALAFQSEVVRAAEGAPESQKLASLQGALRGRAELLAQAGRPAEALADIEVVAGLIARLDSEVRATVEGDLLRARAEVLVDVDPEAALGASQAAFEAFRRTDYQLGIPSSLAARSSAFLALGRGQEATSDLVSAIEALDRQRAAIETRDHVNDESDGGQDIDGSDLVLHFIARSRPVFDRAVAVHAATSGEQETALLLSEMSRSGELLRRKGTQTTPGATTPSTAREWPRRVAEVAASTSILSYRVNPDRLLIWVVNGRGIEMTEVDVGAADLTREVETLARAITRRDEEAFLEVSARLHDLLISPLESMLGDAETLIIVPDAALHAVPFSALRARTDGRYVIERFNVGLAPSIDAFLASRVRYDERASLAERPKLLAIGNPDVDRRLGLPELSGAEREAHGVARLYGGAHPVPPNQATPTRFASDARAADVIHFAGHAVVNEASTLDSYLALTPDEEGSGLLFESDLRAFELPRTRLVVLSACHSAAGRWLRVEGVSGLARSLMAAGVPVVVASLWKVYDLPNDEFFIEFHERLLSGARPAEALAAAKRSAITGAGAATSPLDWAAFEAYGGG